MALVRRVSGSIRFQNIKVDSFPMRSGTCLFTKGYPGRMRSGDVSSFPFCQYSLPQLYITYGVCFVLFFGCAGSSLWCMDSCLIVAPGASLITEHRLQSVWAHRFGVFNVNKKYHVLN